jgi:hypothetical protein
MHTKFWLENLHGRDHSECLGTDRKILEGILGTEGVKVWTGCIWLRRGTNGGIMSACK